eukprot:TRINITY_DN4655_c0_g1_i1.p1 TRINITY_DN4655_c0_g1~~TRINITY_DN4655_c0_g1_i1.p1  ORF type:complete len:462 (-),score=70.03 TRINITY_DN4655_c0_g1_i1:57-1277(-)
MRSSAGIWRKVSSNGVIRQAWVTSPKSDRTLRSVVRHSLSAPRSLHFQSAAPLSSSTIPHFPSFPAASQLHGPLNFRSYSSEASEITAANCDDILSNNTDALLRHQNPAWVEKDTPSLSDIEKSLQQLLKSQKKEITEDERIWIQMMWAHESKPDKVLSTYQSMVKVCGPPPPVARLILINSYLSADRCNDATKVLSELQSEMGNETPPGVFFPFIVYHAARQNIEEIQKIETQLGALTSPLEVPMYDALLNAYHTSESSGERCFKLYDDMTAAGLTGTNHTFAVLISEAQRFRNDKRMIHFFQEMQRKGLTPDEGHFMLMIGYYLKNESLPKDERPRNAGGVKIAHQYFEMMKKAGHVPPIEAYNALMDAYAKRGNFAAQAVLAADMQAKKIANPMDHDEEDYIT